MRFRGINGVPVDKPLPELCKHYFNLPKLEDLPIEFSDVKREDVDPRAHQKAANEKKQSLLDFGGGWDNRRGVPSSAEVVQIGTFYEVFTGGIMGHRMGMAINLESGIVEETIKLENTLIDIGGFKTSLLEQLNVARPDIWGEVSSTDSKAYSRSNSLFLKPRQIELYDQMQKLHPNKPLDYMVYIHTPDLKQKKFTLEGEIEAKASTRTEAALILPFSLIKALYQRNDNDKPTGHPEKLVYHYEGEKHQPYSKVLNSTRNRLLFHDDFHYVAEIMGLAGVYDHDTYKLPNNMKVEGNKMEPFPIVRVSERQEDIPF